MATVADLIRRSLTKIGALADGETPTASQLADAFSDLNTMLDGWAAEGLDVTTFVATTDTVDLAPGYEKAILYNLAIEVAPDFGAQPSQEILNGAATKDIIKRNNYEPTYLTSDPLLLTPGTVDLTNLE